MHMRGATLNHEVFLAVAYHSPLVQQRYETLWCLMIDSNVVGNNNDYIVPSNYEYT